MDEPLIPELPEVPFFPGSEPPAGQHGDFDGQTSGYVQDFGPDPLGAPYPGSASQPAGRPMPPSPSGPAAGTHPSGPDRLAASDTAVADPAVADPAVAGATMSGPGARDHGSDHPVLPFLENTGFFQRPAAFGDASRNHVDGNTWRTGEPDPPAVTTGTHARIDAAGQRARRPRQTVKSGNGLPGWAAITLSLACTGAALLADLALTSSIGVLFGLCFVLTSFGVAAGVRRTAMFTAGVLPPLAALAAFVVLGVAAPGRFVETDGLLGVGTAILSGLAASAWFLVAAWAVALGTLALRTARQPARPGRPGTV